METNVKRESKGRKKIEIKKIDKQSSRQVTFSKRRDGLFTKASELCILTGAEAAIITFSPIRGNPFTFGSPSVDIIMDRYLSGSTSQEVNTNQFEQYKEHMESLAKLEAEKKREETIMEAAKERRDRFWWEEYSIDECLELEELEEYVASMEEIRQNLVTRVNEMEKTNSTTSPLGF